MAPRPPRSGFAREALVRAIGRASQRLDAALEHALVTPAQLEASVRWRGAGATVRGGRLIVESASFELVTALAATLDIDLPPLASHLAAIADAERVPLIAGCDVSAPEPVAKLYLNLSDASADVRRRLREHAAIGVPVEDAPHILGLNVARGGRVGVKLYRQGQDALALAAIAEIDGAVSLARACVDAATSAGALVSWDLDGDAARPRVFFVALARGAEEAAARIVRALPGFDPRAIAAALPFAPGPARFIAVGANGESSLYFRPRGGAALPTTLDPDACFRAGDDEIGVFVAPRSGAERAYARTARHAISYRHRQGSPDPHDVEALMRWVIERVRDAEASDDANAAERLRTSAPPAPWRVVDDGEASRHEGSPRAPSTRSR